MLLISQTIFFLQTLDDRPWRAGGFSWNTELFPYPAEFLLESRYNLKSWSPRGPLSGQQHGDISQHALHNNTPYLPVWMLSDRISSGGEKCVFNRCINSSCGAERKEDPENKTAQKGSAGGRMRGEIQLCPLSTEQQQLIISYNVKKSWAVWCQCLLWLLI